MPSYKITDQLQHAMQHPAPHLDRWANFGPAFEMPESTPVEIYSAERRAHEAQYDPDATPQTYRQLAPAASQPAEQPAAADSAFPPPLAALDNATSATFNPRAFITAGAAIFTLQGVQARYTYRVNRKEPEPGSRYTEPAYFVSLLTGADNLHDYTYIGMLDVQNGAIRLTKASRYTADSQPVKAFNWAIGRIWRSQPIEPAKLYHVGRCGRCGRALTVPASIESGFGPECASKLGE